MIMVEFTTVYDAILFGQLLKKQIIHLMLDVSRNMTYVNV